MTSGTAARLSSRFTMYAAVSPSPPRMNCPPASPESRMSAESGSGAADTPSPTCSAAEATDDIVGETLTGPRGRTPSASLPPSERASIVAKSIGCRRCRRLPLRHRRSRDDRHAPRKRDHGGPQRGALPRRGGRERARPELQRLRGHHLRRRIHRRNPDDRSLASRNAIRSGSECSAPSTTRASRSR